MLNTFWYPKVVSMRWGAVSTPARYVPAPAEAEEVALARFAVGPAGGAALFFPLAVAAAARAGAIRTFLAASSVRRGSFGSLRSSRHGFVARTSAWHFSQKCLYSGTFLSPPSGPALAVPLPFPGRHFAPHCGQLGLSPVGVKRHHLSLVRRNTASRPSLSCLTTVCTWFCGSLGLGRCSVTLPVTHPRSVVHTAIFVFGGGGGGPFPCAARISWFHALCVTPHVLTTGFSLFLPGPPWSTFFGR